MKKQYTLLGHNIGYSLSPHLHGLIARAAGLDIEYTLTDVSLAALPAAVERLKLSADGFNVTKPYKLAILPYLSETNKGAQKIGAVNTVTVCDGEMRGDNTDAIGFRGALDMCGFELTPDTKVLVLGAGGAARSAVYALSGLCRVVLCNRSFERARELAACYPDADIQSVDTDKVGGGYDYIVNATTLGLNGEMSLPESADLFGVRGVYDMIYAPAETPLMARARKAGVKADNGLSMLVLQAVAAQHIWNGVSLDADTVKKIMFEVRSI